VYVHNNMLRRELTLKISSNLILELGAELPRSYGVDLINLIK